MSSRPDPASPIIYLDLDGVIVDLVGGMLSLFDATCDATAVTSWDGMPAAINAHPPLSDEAALLRRAVPSDRGALLPSQVASLCRQQYLFPARWPDAAPVSITNKDLWAAVAGVGASFWANLEPLPWAADLVRAVERLVPRENVHLVTAPQLEPSSWSGKAAWVSRHLPEYMSRLRLCFDKSHLVRPDQVRLLVDDGAHNVEAWRRAGGSAHLWPMPWNSPADGTAYTAPNIALAKLESAVTRAVQAAHGMREMRLL